MNGYNFTERVRKVLKLAREDAIARQHEYVGTEHLLLGLIAEGEGVGAAALQSVGIDLGEVTARVEAVLPEGNASPPMGPADPPYTSRAKKVLEFAMAEARGWDHSYIGSEHLLLGLLREERGIAAQVLTASGASLDIVHKETMRLLGTESSQAQVAVHKPNITSIAIDVRLADGSHMQKECRNVADALRFLKQAAYDSARRSAS
ncbi:MAG: hypothetical protein IT353_11370 [Gemmatimonadaceae bacterium]|nr:hypothetical protein [Gemmatimonadaceae bacterium]